MKRKSCKSRRNSKRCSCRKKSKRSKGNCSRKSRRSHKGGKKRSSKKSRRSRKSRRTSKKRRSRKSRKHRGGEACKSLDKPKLKCATEEQKNMYCDGDKFNDLMDCTGKKECNLDRFNNAKETWTCEKDCTPAAASGGFDFWGMF